MSAFSQIDGSTYEKKVNREIATLGSIQLMFNKYLVGKPITLDSYKKINRLSRILKYSECYSDIDKKCLVEQINKELR